LRRIRAITEMCGDEKGYVAILNPKLAEESIEIAKKKLEKIVLNTRLIVRGYYKEKLISIYKNGRITVKEVNSREEAEKIFEDLLL
jgi:ArsR family metal-binding transcriptional regulator